jgi:ABC-type transport system substrate-binding protein
MLAVIAAAGCPARSRQTPDDTVVVLIESPMTTADPRTISNHDATPSRLISIGLFSMDAEHAAATDLAANIEQRDDLTWDVDPHTRSSPTATVTAEDVAETFRSVYKPDSDSLWHNAPSTASSRRWPTSCGSI